MGQQQLLLIILGVIIVGIAIAVGLQLFQSGSIGANQDALINDVMNVTAHADQWRIRPESMGGGGGNFDTGDGYDVPARMATTGNGWITVPTTTANTVTVRAESSIHTGGWVQVVYNADGTDDAARYDWTADGAVFEIN